MAPATARWTRAWRAQVRPLDTARAAHRRATAVGLALVLSVPALAGCEYTYEDDWYPPEADISTAPAIPEPPVRRRGPPAVGVEEMRVWGQDALPGATGEVVHRSLFRLEEGEVRTEDTTVLEPGTYSVSMACRSVRRIDFLVRNGDSALIDLRLLCGSARVSVIQLPAEAVLSLRVHADEAANVAYRVVLL